MADFSQGTASLDTIESGVELKTQERVPLPESYLDQPEFRKLYTSRSDCLSMRFHVSGIKCSKCIQKIEGLAQKISGLRDVRVNLTSGMTQVELIPGEGSFAEFMGGVRSLGFEVQPVQDATEEELALRNEERRDLIRLAIVGASAGNIMTFAFANYFGQVGVGATLMNYLSLGLFLPVLFYGGLPFYQSAFQALKERRISVDTPITVAFVFGSLCSIVSVFTGRNLIYFDSLSGFLFLILLSRWSQKKLQRHFLSKMQALNFVGILRAKVHRQDQWVTLPASSLKISDEILLEENEIVPADIQIQEPRGGIFDFSFLTGESMPRNFGMGMRVPAGTRCLSKTPIKARIIQPPEASEFSKLMSQIREGALVKTRALNLADRTAQILLIVVFSVAAVLLVSYWFVDPEEAIARSLALVILACPCAIAFGTPLALSFTLKKAIENGILIKSADVFEKLIQARHIFLDKTGTITANRFQVLRTEPAELSPDLIQLIIQLESLSYHPIAFAIRDYFSGNRKLGSISADSLELDDHVEFPGVGVRGLFNGQQYELKKVEAGSGGGKKIGLYRDGVLICEILLQEELLPDTQKSILSLKESNHRIYLVSGDQTEFVNDLGQQLGIAKEDCYSELGPYQKAELLGHFQHSVMIGDGINDALALQKADVGIAVRGSVEAALRTADVYLLSQGIQSVPLLFSLSERLRMLLRKNIILALIYNSLGGIGAVMGWVNPFIAAILMPISSGIILLNSWWESRK